MSKIKRIYVLVLTFILIAANLPVSVKASGDAIEDYSFEALIDKNYQKNPYISFEVGQTYALKPTIFYKNFCSSKYLNGDEGFSFTSKDSSIVSVDKTKGVLTGKKVGTTSITVSLPGCSKVSIDVNIIAERKSKSALKDHEAIQAIDQMSLIKFEEKNVIDYYNKLRNLKKGSMTKKEHFMNIPNEYKISQMEIKLDEYLSKQNALFYCSNPIQVSKITKLTKDKMTVKLNRKITKADLIAYASAHEKKCDVDMLLDVYLYIYTGGKNPMDKNSKAIAKIKVPVGLNDDTISINIDKYLKSKRTYYVAFYYSDMHGDYQITDGLQFKSK